MPIPRVAETFGREKRLPSTGAYMNLAVLSLNYKLAPVEVRERMDIPESRLAQLTAELKERAGLTELMVVSTCNRVEFYFVARDEEFATTHLKAWLNERAGADAGRNLERMMMLLSRRVALIHLFRVACSLESMVVGEPQILGQVKEAFQLAVRHGNAGAVLTGLMPRVFRTAKRVRTETQIARNAVSVSYAAVELASKIFDSLDDKIVLVIGAGDMAELAINHLIKQGIGRLMITNRTFANGIALAQKYQGQAFPFDQLDSSLPEADIVISSTGAREHIITKDRARKAMRERKNAPMFYIDIAVPRDIDPEVNSLPNVYLYDVDDLNSVIDANRREREDEALKAQRIIEEDVAAYDRWYDSLAVGPTIKALRQGFHAIGERELSRTLEHLPDLGAHDAQRVRQLVRGLVNKLLHAPSNALRKLAEDGNGKMYVEAVSVLFDLGESAHAPVDDREVGEGELAASTDEEPEDSNRIIPFPVA